MVVDSGSFSQYLEDGPVLFIGDGAQKCSGILANANAHFHQCNPKASSMLRPAEKAFNEKRFEDVAYFEPFYLKQFIPTVGKHKVF
jgi:tRNA threonylcarbamoyladenosine biosynthesis protein TsaB